MRLCSIELLRIIMTFFIMLGHFMLNMPKLNAEINAKFFHQTFWGVEAFFIIAGYFLYNRILQNKTTPGQMFKGLYWRLLPALLITFLILCPFSLAKLDNIFTILFLLPGMSVYGQVYGWGDWFIGVYFWVMMFYFVLLTTTENRRMLIVCALVYISLCLKVNLAPMANNLMSTYTPLDGTYHGIVGVSFVRGVYGIGLGILTRAAVEWLHITPNKSERNIFTILELALFILTICFVGGDYKIYFVNFSLAFCILLFCFAQGLGYFSAALNRMRIFENIAKYSYSVFVVHAAVVLLFIKYGLFQKETPEVLLAAYVVSIILGWLEYQLVEKRIVTYFKNKKAMTATKNLVD